MQGYCCEFPTFRCLRLEHLDYILPACPPVSLQRNLDDETLLIGAMSSAAISSTHAVRSR